MQIHITIDSNTTPDQISKLAAALAALNGVAPFVPSCGEVQPQLESESTKPKEEAPAKAEPKSRSKGKAEPKVEPEPEAGDEPEAEPEKPAAKKADVDYAALRAETRELFAAYAEEAGTAKGLALLQEFDVAKFKDLEDGQLAAMRKRLLELGE